MAVVCPECDRQALATVDYDTQEARLVCADCGYSKTSSTKIVIAGSSADAHVAAHEYFNAELWYQLPFRDAFFVAYNKEHLLYLESYISAGLREHKDRTHFTLLEKLPRFYHEAKNREALLKLIAKLKKK